jgi:hypothetical protein
MPRQEQMLMAGQPAKSGETWGTRPTARESTLKPTRLRSAVPTLRQVQGRLLRKSRRVGQPANIAKVTSVM